MGHKDEIYLLHNGDHPFGIYIHWPFCKAKCPYCDFNSHVARATDQAQWREALRLALARMSERIAKKQVASVFFGGGTPSLMAPQTVGALLDDIAQIYPLAEDLEVTLEANPTSVEARTFRDFAKAGVNRVSIGVQALNDRDLQFLGRQHSAREALQAVALARETFARISFDLIYARPGQGGADWARELQEALRHAPDHLSLYQLTMEPGTPFGELYARGKFETLDEDAAADLYALTQEICEGAGLPAYEVSNHARPGFECRHNLVYWRYRDYMGVGPGAHGRLKGVATACHRGPQDWLDAIARGGDGAQSVERLSREDLGTEYLLMSLRLSEGTRASRYAALRGAPLAPAAIEALAADGLMTQEGDVLRATPRGRLLLNRVIAALLD